MKVIQKEKREVEVTVEAFTLCDKCDEKIMMEDAYDVFECELVHKMGSRYPEGGDGDKQDMQLCQKCAKELIVLLKANGYRINEGEWSY